jgi:hypothetical protein
MTSLKTLITKQINILKKFGWIIKNFNSRNKMSKGAVGFVDYLIVNKKYKKIIFVECKIGNDKFSDEQIEFRDAITAISLEGRHICYITMTEANYIDIIDNLIKYMGEH